MTPASNDYDVLVVGAGPTGLTLANILGTDVPPIADQGFERYTRPS